MQLSKNIFAEISSDRAQMLEKDIILPAPLDFFTALFREEPRQRKVAAGAFQIFDSLGVYCLQKYADSFIYSVTFVFRRDTRRPFCPENFFRGTIRVLDANLNSGILHSKLEADLCPPLNPLLPSVLTGYVANVHISIESEPRGDNSILDKCLSYASITFPKKRYSTTNP